MLEANYLNILLVPVYSKPVETTEDILERGLTILFSFGFQPTLDRMCGDLRDLDEASRQNLTMREQLCLVSISSKV